MDVAIGDIIETEVGGPYEVLKVDGNLVEFKMKNGMGMTITKFVTKIISKATDACEYSGLPSVKSYENK